MYVVYEKESTRRIDRLPAGPNRHVFETVASAKSARTRFLKAQTTYGLDDILIAPSGEFYASIEKTITGVSAQDGKTPVTVKANIDYCCDPRHERYWAM